MSPPTFFTNGNPNPPNGDAATTEWSSAVGHAATGKSGRVIHNLQEDIARLTRECSLYRSRAEETQRINEAFKTQVQNLTDRLQNFEHSHEMNLHSLSRKEKKIEELRAEIQAERERRQRAEDEKEKFRQLMDEAQDDFHQKSAELTEIANHSRTQYDVLAKAGQRERADQQRRLKGIREEFIALREKHEKTNSQIDRLDTIMAQKDQELELARANFETFSKEYETYKRTHDEEVRSLIEASQQGEARFSAALASLKETEGRMKWVMQVKREVDGAE
jgi:chromosome segregation ATPase